MVFSSLTFLFAFLPVTLILYYIVPRKLKNLILLFFSLIFYAWGEPVYILLMLYSIFMNYVTGRLMESSPRYKKQILVFNVFLNLLILGFFKYQLLIVETVNPVLSLIDLKLPVRKIGLPIGISFYTFQALSYSIDLYRGKFPAQKNIINFALYITMFPQLIAGPIVRYEDIEKQLKEREISLQKIGKGAVIFTAGLGMKVLLANPLGGVFEEIGALSVQLSAATAWLRTLSYFFQIYFDFAGYSLMAIGLGKMMGFEFLKNFDHPYMSAGVTDFWRRWHMSLGTWFREYVYIPLGGNRVSVPRHVLNILIVWGLTGLWHGASWNFLFWGLYYGVILLFEKYVLLKLHLPKVFLWIFMIFIVMSGWVFFFSEDLPSAFYHLRAMFGSAGTLTDVYTRHYALDYGILFILAGIFSTGLPGALFRKLSGNTFGRIICMILYLVILVLSVIYLVSESYNPFLYFRF